MRNMVMILDNLHDRASLSATSEATPVEFTQRSGRSYGYRTDGLSNQVITATLDTPTFLTDLVVYGHNLSSAGTMRIEYIFNEEVVFDSDVRYVSTLIPIGQWRAGIDPWGGADLTQLPTVQFSVSTESTLATGYRITLNDPGNPDGYLEISRIFTGYSYSPEYNLSYGVSLTWEDFAQHRRTESGSLHTVGQGEARKLTFDLAHLSQSEQILLSRTMLRSAKGRDIYVSIYPGAGGLKEAEHAFVGRRESPYGHQHTHFNNWQSSLEIWEI